MDASYWKERCTAAEAALAKARAAVKLTEGRKRALSLLGDLVQGQWLDTHRACEALQMDEEQGRALLVGLEKLGLVERLPGRRGIGGEPARWRLGHLVQVEASDQC